MNNPTKKEVDFLLLELTTRCNFHCPHCAVPQEAYEKQGAVISTPEIFNLIDQIVQTNYLKLVFTGGEPLLHPDFKEIYRYAKEQGFLICIKTNGSLITTRLADFLAEFPPFDLQLSLYGMSEPTYEKVTRTNGSFQRVMAGIKLILARKINLSLVTLATQQNQTDLPLIKAYAQELGVRFYGNCLIWPPCYQAKADLTGIRLSPGEIREIIKWSTEDKKSGRPKKFSNNGNRLFHCLPGRKGFCISAQGELSPCGAFRGITYNLRHIPFARTCRELVARLSPLRLESSHRCWNCSLYGNLCPVCPAVVDDDPELLDYFCEIGRLIAGNSGDTIHKV